MSPRLAHMHDLSVYVASLPDAPPGAAETVDALLTEHGADDVRHYFFGWDAA